MMNRITPLKNKILILILGQALLCWLEAYLISKISLIGRIGIATVHKEYKLLRSGWKTFLLFFTIQLLVILILAYTEKKYSKKVSRLVISFFLSLAIIGLLASYMDFLHTYTHRLLKERFHLGFYFFWLGWIGSCIFFFTLISYQKKPDPVTFPTDEKLPDSISM